MKPKVGLVIQRYGLEITGGSEMLARRVAEKLLPYYDLEVITTCAIDHLSWRNTLPPGEGSLDGVRLRRFACAEERSLLGFHEIYDRILYEQLEPAREHRLIRLQGPYCPDLTAYLKKHSSEYDAFVFFTYLYYPTVAGLPLVAEKAAFVPTVHDETSLYLNLYDELFHLTPWLIFNTDEEMYLAQRRFNLPEGVGRVVGSGIESPEPGPPDASWEPIAAKLADTQVLTYIGRVENGKGCDDMVEYFLRFLEEERRDDVSLLMLGKRTLAIPNHRRLISPGFVSEYAKYQALQRTTVALAPSPFESLCIAALESWMHERPVLANGRSPVLQGHCVRSNGGLWYSNYFEFREALKLLLSSEPLRSSLGAQGRSYVQDTYRWDVVVQGYREVIDSVIAGANPRARSALTV